VHLYFIVNPQRSAITYYRQELPARIITELNLARADTRLWVEMGQTAEERYRNVMNSTGLLFYTTVGPDILKLERKLKKSPSEDLGLGQFAHPPCVFQDTDDNTHFINPLNPAFARLGTRNIDGKLLTPGESLNIVNERGEKVPLWVDGQSNFDIQRNLTRSKYLDLCYKSASGVSFTTERLRDYYVKALKLRNTWVLPNMVRFADYPDIRISKARGQVRVLWQGGDSHYGDWYSLRPHLRPLTERFPELRWVIWGAVFPFVHREIPLNQLITEEWVPYDAYKIRLATIDFDFAVAPLVPNVFNEAKSAIKFYEAAALPKPRPILAARTPPYSDEIVDGETGLLYSDGNEFETKFEMMVRDRKLRKRLAENAKEWLSERRDAYKVIPKYFEWIRDTASRVQERRKRRYGGLAKQGGNGDLRLVQQQVPGK